MIPDEKETIMGWSGLTFRIIIVERSASAVEQSAARAFRR